MTEQINNQQSVTSDDKLWGLLAWLITPIVPIILLLMDDKKNRPFIRSHAVQSLAWGIIVTVATTLLTITIILSPLAVVIGIASLVFIIIWAIKAYNGETVTIPVVTDFVKKQNWI